MTFYYACAKSVVWEKLARGPTRILTDSVRKRNRKGVLANYNKTIELI